MADSRKDKLIESLLKPGGSNLTKGGPLIQPIGDDVVQETVFANTIDRTPKDEGPSLLEQMMALQMEAKKVQEKEKAEIVKKSTATFGNGFKKGFFGGEGKAIAPKSNSSSSSSSSSRTKPNPPEEEILTIRPTLKPSTTSKAMVLEEVQSAMREEDHALLNNLKAGEWVTPDLTKIMMSNDILCKGLKNPKCLQAIELMQKNPKEAQKKFAGDPDVDVFMREFGRVMAQHFESIGNSQAKAESNGKSAGSESRPPVGPLHAQVLQRSAAGSSKIMETTTQDEARVKEILEDEELRGFLMDPDLQRILQECNDPIAFQKHMRHAPTAAKIKRLFDAGLVGTAKDVK